MDYRGGCTGDACVAPRPPRAYGHGAALCRLLPTSPESAKNPLSIRYPCVRLRVLVCQSRTAAATYPQRSAHIW
jgi:hypothetical protein